MLDISANVEGDRADVHGRGYHRGMVNPGLMDQVMQLDEVSRLELRDAIDASVGLPLLTPELEALLADRVADDDVANWEDYVSVEDDERETWARRTPSA